MRDVSVVMAHITAASVIIDVVEDVVSDVGDRSLRRPVTMATDDITS